MNRCVAKGLAVVQGNADADLPVYPDAAYDVAILSKTIKELARPKFVLDELSRIARRVIISFRNYGHWKVRTTLLTTGRIPNLGSSSGWWSDGARRPCTARDMAELAAEAGLTVAAATAVNGKPITGKSLSASTGQPKNSSSFWSGRRPDAAASAQLRKIRSTTC